MEKELKKLFTIFQRNLKHRKIKFRIIIRQKLQAQKKSEMVSTFQILQFAYKKLCKIFLEKI